jgi:hypothetical protein
MPQLLTMAFPHLKQAIDEEDLPNPFLLQRGAARAAASAEKARKKLAAAKAARTKK